VETGVTIHRTVKELDAGPIAAQAAFLIEEDDDAGEVYARAAALAADLLDDVLADAEPAFRPQPEEGVTYASKIEPDDRILDLARPARELVDVVRGLSPHIGARAVLEGRTVAIWRARVDEDGRFEPLEVQPEGGRRMEYAAWRRGLR
jgi:methionyl-tRNA formyltransferase